MSIRMKVGTVPIYLFFIFPISQIMVYMGNWEVILKTRMLGAACIILGIIADVIWLFVLWQGTMQATVEEELAEVSHLKEMKQAYHEMLEKRGEKLVLIRELYAVQLRDVCRMVETGNSFQAEGVLKELQENMKEAEIFRFCQNMTVNAVLSEKQRECIKLGFSIDADIRVASDIPIEPLHLCSIFSNLLDNAIASNRAVEEHRRMVAIRTDYKGTYFFLKISNAAQDTYVKRDLESGRGFGKQILNDIAKKYEGKYMDTYENGLFSAMLMLKLGEVDIWGSV